MAIASGILMVLLFPRPGWGWLAWIALVPLLALVTTLRPRAAFGYATLSGLIFFTLLLYWIARFGCAPWLALSGMMALYIGLFGWLSALAVRGRRGWTRILIPAAIWVAVEWARSLFITGFTWGTLAYSQAPFQPLIQLASVLGPHSISFLIVAMNGAIVDLLLVGHGIQPGTEAPLGHGPRSLRRLGTVAGVVILICIWGGSWGTRTQRSPGPSPSTLRVAVIQGNRLEELDVVWTSTLVQDTVNTYVKLTEKSLPGKPKLIVWPETAVPDYLMENKAVSKQIRLLARKSRAFLLIGGSSRDGKGRIYNTQFLFAPDGSLVGTYSKVHLVPFGEFVPWRDHADILKRWPIRDFDYAAGPGYSPLKLDAEKLGVSICFESIFPQISRAFVRQGATLLVVVTNDAWYGRSAAAAQHAQMSVFRAVENRRWLIRAATSGISMFVDPTGGVHQPTELFAERVLTENVYPSRYFSPYTRTGNLFAVLCGLAALVCVLRKPE